MDILKLAREAGFIEKDAAGSLYLECWPGSLQRFADLVLEEAAKVCDQADIAGGVDPSWCSAAIRAMKERGNG